MNRRLTSQIDMDGGDAGGVAPRIDAVVRPINKYILYKNEWLSTVVIIVGAARQ